MPALGIDRKARRLTPNVRAFYSAIMSYGGPRVHNLVSEIFLGPAISGTKQFRSSFFQYEYGMIEAQVVHVKQRLVEYGILDVPVIIGEDGSALVTRLDAIKPKEADPDGKEKVLVYGLCGGVRAVESPQQLDELINELKPATTLYAWVVIPLVHGAPHLPLIIECHDNTKQHLDTERVVKYWNWFSEQFRKHGIELVGHTYDGDRRCVNAGLSHMCGQTRRPRHAEDIQFSNTPLLAEFRAPYIVEAGSTTGSHRIFYVDCLHTCWRLRVQYLDVKRKFWICGMFATAAHLKTWHTRTKAGILRESDWDHRDKVSWHGFLRLADFQLKHGKIVGTGNLRSGIGMDGDYDGDSLYLELLHKYARIWWWKGRSVTELIQDAVWCILLIQAWEASIHDFCDSDGQKYTLKENFLTRDTANHVVQSCVALLLTLELFKTKYPTYCVVPDRLTSRFNEYLFAFMRTDIKGQGKFSCYGAAWHMRHYDCNMHCEASTDLVRGAPDLSSLS